MQAMKTRTHVHYRVLTTHWDPEAYQAAVEEARAREFAIGGSSRTESVPEQVEALEGSTTLSGLEDLVRLRALIGSDLVNVGNGWESVRESAALADVAYQSRRPRWVERRFPSRARTQLLQKGGARFAVALAETRGRRGTLWYCLAQLGAVSTLVALTPTLQWVMGLVGAALCFKASILFAYLASRVRRLVSGTAAFDYGGVFVKSNLLFWCAQAVLQFRWHAIEEPFLWAVMVVPLSSAVLGLGAQLVTPEKQPTLTPQR